MFPMIAGSPSGKTYIEDVFSAYVLNASPAGVTLTGLPNLATYGGMVWGKGRSSVGQNHFICDTARGRSFGLATEQTAAQTTSGTTADITSFNVDGFSLGTASNFNWSTSSNVFWTYRNARNFFQVLSVTKTAGSNKVIDLSPYMTTVGMVKVKRTDAAGSWYVWHRSLSAGQLLIGETTAAAATLGQITVSGTTLTLVDGVIADGTYHIEAYAHDTSADGLIQCGSFTTDASGNATVTLGWEPQLVDIKGITTASNWFVADSMRGMSLAGNTALLYSDSSVAESAGGVYFTPTATGFNCVNAGLSPSKTYAYMVIRRGPMKPPTSGTQVYNAIAYTGSGSATARNYLNAGFAPDLQIGAMRSGSSILVTDRLRGALQYLDTTATSTEASSTGNLYFDNSGATAIVAAASSNIAWLLRRYPGVFDIVPHTGNSAATRQIVHGLTVIPELRITKSRSGIDSWVVVAQGIKPTSPNTMRLNGTEAWTAGFTTADSATEFTVSTSGIGSSNDNNVTYITYLFATLAGISKVFSYTGNGSSQTINCGFAAGARFVLIKRTDAVGNWVLVDTVRGLVAGSDPILLLNSTAAEDTSVDILDPAASGFIVNQEAAYNLNVNLATYVGVAIS